MQHTNLGTGLLRRVFSVYLVIAVVVTGIQLWDTYRQAQSELVIEFESVEKAFDRALEHAVWHLDSEEVISVVQGVLSSPAISGVSVYDIDGRWLHRQGTLPQEQQSTEPAVITIEGGMAVSFSSDLLSHTVEIHNHFTQSSEPTLQAQQLGVVYFYADSEVIFNKVRHDVFSILIAATVKTIALWLIFLYFIKYIVTLPLERLTQRAYDLRVTEPKKTEAVPGSETTPIELIYLEQGMDRLEEYVAREKEHKEQLIDFNRMLETEVEQRTRELTKATQAKDEFFAAMSHELRTPLTTIIGNCDLLRQGNYCGGAGCPEEEAAQMLDSIYSAGSNQLALVNDILDMSKIESGNFTIDEEPYDLTRLVAELEGMFSIRAADKGIGFEVDLKHHEKYLLMGDAQRISQILINLIGNAIKFTMEGEVKLTIWLDAGQLVFQIKDTGIGMSRAVVDGLFQRFQQADGTISRRFGGSGLGLYISENLSVMMDGELEVFSEEGVGSIFKLSLPYQATSTLVSVKEREEIEGSVVNQRLCGRVLIAEDTPELQILEKRILKSLGLDVSVARDGQEAVDLVRSDEFDVVLMDMQMPGIDGIEATRMLRAEGYTLPIIALTANVMQKHRDAFNEAGCDGFIGKPIDKNKLGKLLKQHLKESESSVPPEADEVVDDELLEIFKESAAGYRQGLQAALELEDWPQVKEFAHIVKSTGASFGFPVLTEKATMLCDDYDNDRFERLSQRTQALIGDLETILS